MAAASSVVRRLYLSVYNWVVFFGWAKVLYYATLALLGSGNETVYAAVEQPLLFAQTVAFTEILHAIVGLVKSPISATLPQISARLFVTWGIVWSFPEIIRYSFFGLKEAFGIIPSWLLWLRYSTFMVFYPIGLVSEVGLIYAALPYMKASEKYCLRMPSKWNFSFDYYYTCLLLTTLYIPGGPHMFRYMLRQRKKALSKAKTT